MIPRNPSTPMLPSAAALLLVAACGGPTSPPPQADPDAEARAGQAGDGEADEQAASGGEGPSEPRVPDALIAFAPCTDDYRALCAEVDPDEGAAVIACLRDHQSALDRHCLATLDPEAPQMRSSRCVAAIGQLCPDADDPASRTECIRRHDRLEGICQRSSGGQGGQQGPAAGGGAGRQGMSGGGLGGGGRPF